MSSAKKDSLLKEKADLVDRQLLTDDNNDSQSRQKLLRALLDEDRLEKERKKRK